ncbi:MAG: hypothetical protein SWK76_15960 [Actinomycetota bacterium]|nr:hypothetical protein [Actinomycetota bacterium]
MDFTERFLKMGHPQESRSEWSEMTAALTAAGFRILRSRKQVLNAGTCRIFLCSKLER